MREITLNRQKLGLEDLAFGTGTEEQVRAGIIVTINKINAGNLPFDETKTLLEFAKDTNIEALGAIVTKLSAIGDNLIQINATFDNLVGINSIVSNLSELLLVNDNAAQVASDKVTVANDKTTVLGYKDAVNTMKLAVETIYDTFDDRFLGSKVNDPIVDNDGNALIDGAMYFNTSSNALKVYDLGNTLWVTIPQIYLSGLLDVTLTSITTGDILTWNGSKWINTRTPSFDSLKLNGGTGTQGTATWNNTEYTYDLVLNPNVTLQVGQEELVYCKNNTASLIANGRPVMAVGTNGNSGNILVDLHDGTKANARRIIGIATEDLAANGYGFVTRNGNVSGINTTGSQYGETWVNGDILYVKATGALTNIEPVDTALKMPIAFVIHAHTAGTLYVRTTGIDENHDRDLIATKITKVSSTDKAIPRFNGTTGDIQSSGIIIDDNNTFIIPMKDNSATFGTELTTNGTFTGSSTGWTLGTNWAYSDNSVVCTLNASAEGTISQNVSVVQNKLYMLTWSQTNSIDTNGQIIPSLGAVIGGKHSLGNTTQTFSQTFRASATGSVALTFTVNDITSTGTITLDSISLVEVIPVIPSIIMNNTENSPEKLEFRTTKATGSIHPNIGIGNGALASNTTGYRNLGIGG